MPAGWISAGAAVVGAIGSIEGNSNSQSATNQNNAFSGTEQTNIESAGNQLVPKAEQVASQPFTPYTGQMAAPLSSNESQAITQASKTAGAGAPGLPYYTAAGQGIENAAAQNWSQPGTQAEYINPYTKDVTNAAIAQSQRSFQQSEAANNLSTASSGAFGTDRAAVQQAELESQENLNEAQITAQGNANAYTAGLNAFQNNQQLQLSAANDLAAVGGDVTQLNSSQIGNLLATGNVQQVTNQTALSDAYNEFIRQQGWSANQLNSLIQTYSALKGGNAQVVPAQASNTANQLLGLGSTLAGLYNANSGNNLSNSTSIGAQPIAGGDISTGYGNDIATGGSGGFDLSSYANSIDLGT